MISLFKPSKNTRIEYYPKATSETFTVNDIVYLNADGRLTKYTDGAAFPMCGLIKKATAATDSDYASATRTPVEVMVPDAVYRCDVSTGSAAATTVGIYIDVDDHNSVDIAASTNNDFFVVGVESSAVVYAKPVRILPITVE